MALPAGCSSDEDYSDDEGLSLYHDNIQVKKINFNNKKLEVDEEELTNENFASAVKEGNIEKVIELIGRADVNYKSKTNSAWSPLMHACSAGHVEIAKLLLENGASANDHVQQLTPLHCICSSNILDEAPLLNCFNLLLQYKANLNARDWHGANSLIHAVKKNWQKLVLMLIHEGCEVDNEDTDGWTPIFYAVDGGYIDLVQILIDSGANIKRIDHQGRSLFELATSKYYKNIAELVNTTGSITEIEDVIEKYKDYKRMSSYERILSELPDKRKGRFNGFPSDAARWIHGIGMDLYVKSLMANNVQLGQIFTMDEDELKDLGFSFSFDRKKIRYCVQSFHEHAWGKNSPRDTKDEIDLFTASQIICNNIRQLHIISTSTYFWKKNFGHDSIRSSKECINKGLYYIRHLRKEIDTLSKIIHEIEEIENIKPCDLITFQNNKKSSPWLNKKSAIITIIFFAIIYKAGKHYSLQILHSLPKLIFPYKILKW